MKIFTIMSGKVLEGAWIEKLALKAAGIEIPAIIIGEEGRGRERGVLPVALLTEEHELKATPDWRRELPYIYNGYMGTTKTGKPKLFEGPVGDGSTDAIIIFRTDMGYRGGNHHTGDRSGWECYGCWAKGEGPIPEVCPKCGRESTSISPTFLDFPGKVVVEGVIAQGDAGRMGHGHQYVVVMPKGSIFRTSYTGRLYGAPSAHYYKWDGEKILGGLTWEERCLSEVF